TSMLSNLQLGIAIPVRSGLGLHDVPECSERRPDELQLGKRQQERQGGLCSLILVDAVLLEAVAAAAGDGIVNLQPEVIVAQVPVEGVPGLLEPIAAVRGTVRRQTRRDRSVGIDRLLVEDGALLALLVEALRADRAEVTLRRR